MSWPNVSLSQDQDQQIRGATVVKYIRNTKDLDFITATQQPVGIKKAIGGNIKPVLNFLKACECASTFIYNNKNSTCLFTGKRTI